MRALPLLVVLVLVPVAQASCVRIQVIDHADIAAVTSTRAITTRGGEWGSYDLATGNFTPFDLPTDGMARFVASPDGAWIAWEMSRNSTPEGAPMRGWDCGLADPVVAVRASDGDPARIDHLLDGRPRALAASPTRLAVAFQGADDVTLVRWGDANVSHLVVDKAAAYAREGWAVDVDPWNASDVVMMRFSPDGALLAIASWNDSDPVHWRRDITVVDVATGIPVPGAIGIGFEGALVDLEFDPASTRLAVMTGYQQQFVEVRVHELRTRGTDRWLGTEAAVALAWGESGLAVALSEPSPIGEPPRNGTLLLLNDTLDEVARRDLPRDMPNALAWATSDQLVVAMDGRIEIFDAALAQEEGEPPAQEAEEKPVALPGAALVFGAATIAIVLLGGSSRSRR